MKETRFFYVPDASKQNVLPADEALHAVRVLRLKCGDEIFLMDGQGSFYRAEVSVVSKKICTYSIKEALPQEKAWRGNIHLAMAPTKMMERVEWFTEKATEIGVDIFSFIQCDYSERKTLRTDRLEKIMISAMKQSRKPWKPQINGMTSMHNFVAEPRKGNKYIAHCYKEIPRIDLFTALQEKICDVNNDFTILIGPEGDFSINEVQWAIEHGFQSISLGNARLRTETAALYAVMMAQLSKRI